MLLLSRSTGCGKQITLLQHSSQRFCIKTLRLGKGSAVLLPVGQHYEKNETDLWWSVEGIRVEDRLDHDQGLGQVLSHKVVPVIGGLIWTVVEHLQEG